MDRILIKDLLARCIIGVDEDERREKQDVVISLILFGDYRKAGLSDDIEDAIDYSILRDSIIREVETTGYHLVEALAERIASICLEHPRVVSVEVTVEKPGALRYARSVGVQIVRDRIQLG